MDLSQITTRELLFNIKNSENNVLISEKQLILTNKQTNMWDSELPTQVCIKPIIGETGGLPKFQIYLTNDRKNGCNTGFLYFYVDFGSMKSQFSGMIINEQLRGNNYANLLLSTYISVCNAANIYDMGTTTTQRKPEVLYILKNFGYMPHGEPNTKMEVNIVRGRDGERLLYIPHIGVREHFENSHLAKKNGYKFISSLTNEEILGVVYFNQHYRLTDYTKCLRKQREVLECFEDKIGILPLSNYKNIPIVRGLL